MKTHYIVYIATAQMPGSCPYPYDYCAVLEVPETMERPSRIDAKEVVRVVERWAPFPCKGSTPRSGRVRALTEARELAADLNKGTMSKAIVFVFGEEPTDADMPPIRFDQIDGVAGEIRRLRAALVGPLELPQEPPRDLSRVAARICPVSGTVSHA